MANRISDTIKKLFPDEFEELVPVKQHWWDRVDWQSFKSGWRLWTVLFVIVFLIVLSVFFYNKFVTMETQVLTDKAQIEAQLQRRKDLLINLTKTVVDYAEHEKRMFIYMADKRADTIEKNDKLIEALKEKGLLNFNKIKEQDLKGAMASLMALAENYPELKLSGNFQKLMDALINIEDRIVERRMAYNDSCNKYGTYIRKFPQNIYAFMFHFGPYPFVEVDKDAELFDRVEY